MKLLRSLLLIFFTSLPLGLAFYNCSMSNPSTLTASHQVENTGGNGGGYNGPNLQFELIPPIADSERLTRLQIGQQLVQAQVRCELGVPERGLTGIQGKYFKIILGKESNPCYLLGTGQSFASTSGNAYNYGSDKDLNNYCSHDFIQDMTKKAFANQGQIISLGSIAFSSFDQSLDPVAYQNNPSWNETKFKFTVNDSQMKPLKHFSLSGNFPMALYTPINFYAAQPSQVNQGAAGDDQVQLKFADNIGEEVPLMDSYMNTPSGASFNSFEYMSCVQGEFYFAQDPAVQTEGLVSLIYPSMISNMNQCPQLSDWIQALNNRQSFDMSLSKFNTQFTSVFQSWTAEYQQRKKTAENLFALYLNGQVDLTQLKDCLSNSPHRRDFLYTLQSVFFFKTIESLRGKNISSLNAFLDRITTSTQGNVWTLFYVAGLGGDSPSKAGVGREKLNTFMNLMDIPRQDWFVIFLHEMSHRLDDKMHAATKAFSDTATLQQVQTILHSSSPDQKSLSPDQNLLLRTWVKNGLQRGLLTEYRAWLFTFTQYKNLRTLGANDKIAWIENYLEGNEVSSPSFSCFLLRKLSNQNQLSSQPEFQQSLLKEILDQELVKVRACDPEYLTP